MKKYWLLILIISSAALLVYYSQSSEHIFSKEKDVSTEKEIDSANGQAVINDGDDSRDAEESPTNTKFEFYEELPNRPVL